jgi:hypothetical protein
LLDRRVWVRYARESKVYCRETGALKGAGWPGKVIDISLGGVGLVLRHCFRAGTPLLLELKNRDGTFQKTMLVRVRYARSVTSQGHHAWHVGCAFLEKLTEEELQALL